MAGFADAARTDDIYGDLRWLKKRGERETAESREQ
jgi:hypothetical protein